MPKQPALLPVTKSDTITVTSLETPKADNRKVIWKEGIMLTEKDATYILVEFSVKTKGETKAAPAAEDQDGGLLFIEKKRVEEFKKEQVEGQPMVFVVSDKFQYGQADSKGTNRWLAYHDKSYKMFQHRFFDKWNWTTNPDLVATAEKFNIGSLFNVADDLKPILGNKLKDF